MNVQGIAKDAKCGRFSFTLDGDASLWYKSKTQFPMIRIICKGFLQTMLQTQTQIRTIPKIVILPV